jgi:hypothetical protein
MATFKELSAADITSTKSGLNQLIDIIQEDVSGSTSRRKYQVFVTGGVGPGITSSLFHTVYDQDYSLQTSNAIFDMTVGCWYSGSDVLTASTGLDSSGKRLYPSHSLMMREKTDNYSQFAQILLGDANGAFYAPGIDSGDSTDRIEHAMFMCFKRLFARDKIKRETFALRWYQSASRANFDDGAGSNIPVTSGTNLDFGTTSGSAIYTDIGSTTDQQIRHGGNVGNLVDSANTSRYVGLLYYDHGIAVFDVSKIISGSQHASGTIAAMRAGAQSHAGTSMAAAGKTVMGWAPAQDWEGAANAKNGDANPYAKFIPDFMVSGSIDDIIEHFSSVRFQSGTLTACTFQNTTNINSTLYFCRASSDEFNYSSNPTFTDTSGNLVVIDDTTDSTQKSFSFITSVGLFDASNNLLAIAKLSRPIEKNDEKDLTIRVRLDF